MRLNAALTRCVAFVRRTAGRIARAASRVVSRFAMPLIAAACSRAETPSPLPDLHASPIVTEAPAPASPDAGVVPPETSFGDYQLTMYYVTHEEEVTPKKPAPANDNTAGETALAATLPDLVPLYDRKCETLATVSRAFAAQLALQGTGRLRDGRVLNVAGRCDCARKPCFHVLPERHKWGMGGSGMPLEPFRTVAVDPRRIKLGSLLYLPELDGMRMPGPRGVGGFIHDGCVVAGDTGGGIKGKQLDLFVARRAYYRGLARRGSHAWAKTTEVLDGTARCQRKGGKVTRSAAGSI
jgi:3D (Asp-Asp-Asp) domain-containing protein